MNVRQTEILRDIVQVINNRSGEAAIIKSFTESDKTLKITLEITIIP